MMKKNINEKKLKILTKAEITSELNREKNKSKLNNIIRSTIYTLIVIAAASAIIATLIMPVVQISGSSMKPNYNSGDITVLYKSKNINYGDVVAFYYGNKILVKRVVGMSGDWINIDEKGKVYINGEYINESYIDNLDKGDCEIEFPYKVPNLSYFVLSDDRTDSIDSRNSDIGSVSYENLIGKLLFKVWPLN